MQVVVIYDLNLSLQFVAINFTFFLLLFFALGDVYMLPEFLHQFLKKNNNKANAIFAKLIFSFFIINWWEKVL